MQPPPRVSLFLDQRVLFERVFMPVPFSREANFEQEGCLLYFRNAHAQVFGLEGRTVVAPQESVLLRCGPYCFDLLDSEPERVAEVVAVHLYPDMLHRIDLSAVAQASSPETAGTVGHPEVMDRFVDSLGLYFDRPDLATDGLLELKLHELVHLLVRTGNVSSLKALIRELHGAPIGELVHVVEQHVYSDIRVEQLAALCGMSVSSFQRKFKAQFGGTPKHYFTARRMDKAKELLRLTSMHVSEVAFDLGFNDPLYFTRLFKKHVGTSPTAYRESGA